MTEPLATPPTASHDETALRAVIEALISRVYRVGPTAALWVADELNAILAARAAAGDADLAGESGGSDG